MEFSTAVYPARLEVFETFSPGAVVAVWGRVPVDDGDAFLWHLLWSGEYEKVFYVIVDFALI